MSDNTRSVSKMLYDEGLTGPLADVVVYEWFQATLPELVTSIRKLVEMGRSPEQIGQGVRAESRKQRTKPNEAHIANCMAIARDIHRQLREGQE